MSNAVKRGELYPVADGEKLPPGFDPKATMVRWDGEWRCPRAGDWFLSGAVVEAYRATSDMDRGYAVGRLVKGRMVFER